MTQEEKLITVLTLIATVKVIEDAIPGKGKGEEKLEATRHILEAAYEASRNPAGTFDKVWPSLNKTINGIVGSLNKTGILTK